LEKKFSQDKIALLKHRINILELFYVGNDTLPKREKKRKADSLSHFFNDDKEASFLVRKWIVDLTCLEEFITDFVNVLLSFS
jgi:hypothetical protein